MAKNIIRNSIKRIKRQKPVTLAFQRSLIEKSGLFHAEWYVKHYHAPGMTTLNALDHYLKSGEADGLKPNPYFDPTWYRDRAPGAQKSKGSALTHYLTKGWQKGRHPSQAFSLTLYRKAYPDVGLDIDPLAYHLTKGQYEGKLAFHLMFQSPKCAPYMRAMIEVAESGLFDAKWYTSYYTDLWSLDSDPLQHFVMHGSQSGRNPNPLFETHWYIKHHQLEAEDNSSQEEPASVVSYIDLPLLHYIREGGSQGLATSPHFDGSTYMADHPDWHSDKTPLGHFLKTTKTTAHKPAQPAKKKIKAEVKKSALLPVADHIRQALTFTPKALAAEKSSYTPDAMDIHWVIPDFAPGGGGHMTIFRMVHFLEVFGHKQTIWIQNPTRHVTPDTAYQEIIKHFQHFGGEVHFLTDDFPTTAKGDVLIATDCWSAYPVMAASNFLRRFYFVQDHEPSFHAVGSEHILAEQTYHFDLDCICASPWLADMMHKTYGHAADHFWLAADRKLYYPPEQTRDNSVPRIAVYARHFTARRAVELAMLGLEALARRGLKFHVDFFGAKLDLAAAPFEMTDHGVASPETLAALFRSADVGLVFSATNYSLVPQEMMACGLPIVELDGESTRAIFPENVVTLAKPHPESIADALAQFIENSEKRHTQAEAGLAWVNQFSWPDSARRVEAAIKAGLARTSAAAQALPQKTSGLVAPISHKAAADVSIKASVVIPTYNAGPVLKAVLDAVTTQEAPWAYEVLVIDSGSTDGTLDIVADYEGVRLHEIASSSFNHGGTRNLGAEMTNGDFIAYLTHDALPYNSRWLYNMVSGLEHYPDAAGAFGKHLAYPAASPFTKRELDAHFATFEGLPLLLNRDSDRKRWRDGDEGWRQVLHFYSDNNSCFRRSVWKKIPYRHVAFGEDQLWARDIIEAGYNKLFVPKAIVYHSHDYGAEETFERAKTESAFFKHFFGYCLMADEKTLKKACVDFQKDDALWAKEYGVSKDTLEEREQLLKARFEGYLAGWQADTTDMF